MISPPSPTPDQPISVKQTIKSAREFAEASEVLPGDLWKLVRLHLRRMADALEQAEQQAKDQTNDYIESVQALSLRLEQAEQWTENWRAQAECFRQPHTAIHQHATAEAQRELLAKVREQIAAIPSIVPSDLTPDEQFDRNGDYINLDLIHRRLDALAPPRDVPQGGC